MAKLTDEEIEKYREAGRIAAIVMRKAKKIVTKGRKLKYICDTLENEIIKLGLALGAKQETFYGLAGIGDLILTSMSEKSRNFSFGKMIGEGKTIQNAKSKIQMVIEGIETVKSTKKIALKYNIEMPIINTVYKVLFEEFDPMKAVNILMTRELKPE